MHQIEMITLEDLVPTDHSYRQYIRLLSFNLLKKSLYDLKFQFGADGYGIERLFKCLLLQFMEDLSDRELERYLQENNAAKWFCRFALSEKTPDYSLFTRVRKRIGTKRLSVLFANMRDQLKQAGYMNEVFSFVDATHLIREC